MIRDNMGCCSPKTSGSDTKEYSKAVQIVFDSVRNIMWSINDIDGKEAQEEAAMKLFTGLGKIKDIGSLAEKILETEKQAKIAQIKSDDEDPEQEECDMMSGMYLDMFEELD